MKYLLMCCIEEARWNGLPEAERAAVMKDYRAWTERLHDSGRHHGSAQLESSASATTVRQRNGKPSITDGPIAETKEQFGGYHLVECKNLDEALALAQGIPTLRVGGTVEVRPVVEAFA
ncbi:MAG: YciI family protein [Gammaproteobacteria bacterium]